MSRRCGAFPSEIACSLGAQVARVEGHIISLIDGKPYKALRRHLSGHGLTPDEYRARYGLKPDYPMVSESYFQVRRDMAKKIGLGRKPGIKIAPKAKAVPKPRGRPRKGS